MCGIVGLISLSNKNVFADLLEALYHLQHRGQDSYGIAITNRFRNKHVIIKRKGLLDSKIKKTIKGAAGVGHVRYPTNGENTIEEAQPLISQGSNHTLILVHNGQVWKTSKLKQYMEHHKINHDVKTDSYLILNLLAHELNQYKQLTNTIIIDSIKHITAILEGSFSCICIIKGYGLVVFKDRHGIRPLIFGRSGDDYLISSESVSITCLDYTPLFDIQTNIVIFKHGVGWSSYKNEIAKFTPCIFEWIYLARADSILYEVPVYLARMGMGRSLAKKIRHDKDIDIIKLDYVVPVPETSRPAALAISGALGVPYIEAIIKNRYVNRTFIMDTQIKRKKNIKRKLNVIQKFIRGKNLLIVDDSIVRGNTMKHIISLLKKNGAKSIVIASCSPEILYENRYGIDIPNRQELIAHKMSPSKMANYYGVKKIFFHNLKEIMSVIQSFNPTIKQFETSIFTGVTK